MPKQKFFANIKKNKISEPNKETVSWSGNMTPVGLVVPTQVFLF